MISFKRLFLTLTLAAALTGMRGANSYGIPAEIQDGNILHCFNWTLNDIKAELPAIAEAGFGAVQISPMQGNCAVGAEWYYAYLPYDFAFSSGGPGNRVQLKQLCEEADKYGIKIVLDVVANHINGSSSHRASKWNNTSYWHSTTFKGINYGNRSSITHDNLGDYPDLNSEHADVRAAAVEFVQKIKEAGVKGIRWDAAKHIGLPSEGCRFWSDVTLDGLWHYGEILDSPGGDENKLAAEYASHMSITDNRYCDGILGTVKAGGCTSSTGLWTTRGIASDKLVYWAESHDTYANDNGATKYVSQDVIDRAWAIVACRQGAAALYLSRPAKTGRTEIKMGVKGSTNFKKTHIAAVNHLRNLMGDTPEYLSSADGVTSITRAGGGACIVVGNGNSRNVSVANGGGYVPAGKYTDQVSGNTFTVTSTTISGQVGPTGIAVIYDPSALTAPRVELEPGACSFKTPTLQIKATAVNATSARYSVNGGAYQTIAAGGTSFAIGEGISEGEISVNWEATGADGSTRSGKAVYTKLDPNTAPADMPATFYILGEVDGNKWSPSTGVAMTRSGATFTATVKINGYFSFAKTLGTGSDWESLNRAGNRYGLATDGSIAIGQPITIMQIDDPKAICLATGTRAGTYRLTVDWNDMSVTLSDPSGVEAPEVSESAEPEYYTLQGLRAQAPLAPGIYIVRRGNEVSKVIIR